MSDCAQAYFHALNDPASEKGNGACLPDFISLPSYKLRTQTYLEFSSNAAGMAFVQANPWQGVASMAAGDMEFDVSDPTLLVPVAQYYSNAALVGTTSPHIYTSLPSISSHRGEPTNSFNFAARNLAAASSNSPHDIRSMIDYQTTADPASLVQGPQWRYRLVGATLIVQYAGTNIDAGGRVLLYRDPGNDMIGTTRDGGLTSNEIINSNTGASTGMTHSRAYNVNFVPQGEDDLAYTPVGDDLKLIRCINDADRYAHYNDYRHLAVMVTGAKGIQPYVAQLVAHYEIQSALTSKTPSHTDAVGLGAISSSSRAAPSVAPQSSQTKDALVATYNKLKDMVSANGASGLGHAAQLAVNYYQRTNRNRNRRIEL